VGVATSKRILAELTPGRDNRQPVDAAELRDLPRGRQRELLGEIRDHIDSAQKRGAGDDETYVRNILERLGEPAEIAEEARHRLGVRRAKPGAPEVGALILLPIGGVVVPVVGWIVGVILLWSSHLWTTRDKLAGTLLFPGGLLIPFYLLFFSVRFCSVERVNGRIVSESCADPSSVEVALSLGGTAVLIIVPIIMIIFLARRLRERPITAAP
jgi:uncharacterized membrane protein